MSTFSVLQDLAALVVHHMEKEGMEVIRKCIPTAVRKEADSLAVSYRDLDTGLEQMVLELFNDLIVPVCTYRNNLTLYSLQQVRHLFLERFL